MLTSKLKSWIFTYLLGTIPVMASWCEYFCNPKKYMKPTCDDKCPGYVFTVSASTTPATEPSSMPPVSTTNVTVVGPTEYVESSSVTTIILIVVVIFLSVIAISCCFKKQIRVCLTRIRYLNLKFPHQVVQDEASQNVFELTDLSVRVQSSSDPDHRRTTDGEELRAFMEQQQQPCDRTNSAPDRTESKPEHSILNMNLSDGSVIFSKKDAEI